jgi:hypothetical protein
LEFSRNILAFGGNEKKSLAFDRRQQPESRGGRVARKMHLKQQLEGIALKRFPGRLVTGVAFLRLWLFAVPSVCVKSLTFDRDIPGEGLL